MKKTASILLALILSATTAAAQNIVFGQRAPEIKVAAWLGGSQPASAELTYVEFFHASNSGCVKCLDRMQSLSRTFGKRLRIVIVTREPEEKIADLFAPYRSERIGIGIDPEGRSFAAFGVSYVPFGVLLDAKNRVLWMGNSHQLTERVIEDAVR